MPIDRYYTPDEFRELKRIGWKAWVQVGRVGTAGAQQLPGRSAGAPAFKAELYPPARAGASALSENEHRVVLTERPGLFIRYFV